MASNVHAYMSPRGFLYMNDRYHLFAGKVKPPDGEWVMIPYHEVTTVWSVVYVLSRDMKNPNAPKPVQEFTTTDKHRLRVTNPENPVLPAHSFNAALVWPYPSEDDVIVNPVAAYNEYIGLGGALTQFAYGEIYADGTYKPDSGGLMNHTYLFDPFSDNPIDPAHPENYSVMNWAAWMISMSHEIVEVEEFVPKTAEDDVEE